MNLKDLKILRQALVELYDFATSNCDGDESGIYEEMSKSFAEASNIIQHEKYKIYLKNAKAKVKRKRKCTSTILPEVQEIAKNLGIKGIDK